MVNTNRLNVPHPVVPLGLCQVAQSAASAGHTVDVLDLCFERNPIDRLCESIRSFHPDAVGITVRNLDNSDVSSPASYIDETVDVVRAVRSSTDASVVLGGPAPSIGPELYLRLTGADCVIVGEGERAFPQLLSELLAGRTSSRRIVAQ